MKRLIESVVVVLMGLFLCLTGVACSEEKNEEPECLVDEDCPYGQFCDVGTCRTLSGEPDAGQEPTPDGDADTGDEGDSRPQDGGEDGADQGPQYDPCEHDPDCSEDEVCSFLQLENDVVTACRNPVPGGMPPGWPCTQNADCRTNLCLCGNSFCEGGDEGRCSAICDTREDCSRGYMCSATSVPDLSGQEHFIFACVRDETVCLRHEDCDEGDCCRMVVGNDAITTRCSSECQGEPNVGEECSAHDQCFSGWCFDYPAYCLDVCEFDGDCPTFDSGTACTIDDDCELGQLCIGGTCKRIFSCRPMVFRLGGGGYDLVDVCLPERVVCQVDSDCRDGEACKIYTDETATEAELQCVEGGPGAGGMGAVCEGVGSSACFSGLCISPSGGGDAYCSQACVDDEDCVPTSQFRCGLLQVTIREGYQDTVHVCKRI